MIVNFYCIIFLNIFIYFAISDEVEVAYGINLRSDLYDRLMNDSYCWANHGTWKSKHASPQNYVWQPDSRCPQFNHDHELCMILEKLNVSQIIFLGDSVSQQFHHHTCHDNHKTSHNSRWYNGRNLLTIEEFKIYGLEFCHHLGLHDCTSHCSIPAIWTRTDRLYTDGDPRQGCLRIPDSYYEKPSNVSFYTLANFIDTNWTYLLDRSVRPIVFINRGAHFEEDEMYIKDWTKALTTIRTQYHDAIVMVRTTPSGIKDCHKYNGSGPIAVPIEMDESWPYHWSDFPRQNSLLRNLVLKKFPGVLFLDLEYLSSLRPDSHAKDDCLHFSQNNASKDIFQTFFAMAANILRSILPQE